MCMRAHRNVRGPVHVKGGRSSVWMVIKTPHQRPRAVEWRLVRRRGTVRARRLVQDFEWTTPGGDILRGASGDWLVTDDSGGQRTVSDDFFRAHHSQLSEDMWERTASLEARQALPGERIESPEGLETASPDDWVLRDATGAQWIVSDKHFRASYRPEGSEA